MLSDFVSEQLERENLSLEEFRELVVRLLNYGVLCRSENQTEQALYDRYCRIPDLVADYFYLLDIQIFHDSRFDYVRLYPPGAQVPGRETDGDSPHAGSLRRRLNQNEVALILVLRMQYDKSLREGKLDDSGYVSESMESLGIAMKNLLGRTLPDKLTERRQLFQRLRQLRLIDYRQDEDIENGEAWLKIHPMIVSFVGEQVLSGLGQPENAIPLEEELIENDEALAKIKAMAGHYVS